MKLAFAEGTVRSAGTIFVNLDEFLTLKLDNEGSKFHF